MNDHEDLEVLLGEITSEDFELHQPPADLWDRIDAEVSAQTPPQSAPSADNVVALDSRRRFPKAVFLGAAAAALVLVVGFAVVSQPNDGSPTLVASAELSFDPENFDALGADASAQVTLVDDDGTYRIDLEESVLPSPAGEAADLELWLIQPDADGNPADLVSLGVVDPDRPGDFEVPATTDPAVFSVVDISVEPRDGDATHSGRSILRGALSQA